MAIFDKYKRLIVVCGVVLVFLLLVGSSMSISNYNALQSAKDQSDDEIQTAIENLEGSNAWSIIMLIVSLLLLLSGGGYVGYKIYQKNIFA